MLLNLLHAIMGIASLVSLSNDIIAADTSAGPERMCRL